MQKIVFYSWQSDLPNATNRGLIQTALEDAAASIAADAAVSVEPVVDRDTQNVPGSPDIASTIFAKITSADIVVADVSIVNRAEQMRPTPNPNVLIELGYALRALGHERVILVFNKSFGKPEELPFDLRTRRLIQYKMSKETTDRSSERKHLSAKFDTALRAALAALPADMAESLPIEAVTAIENVVPNRKIILRRSLADTLRKIESLEPKKPRDGGTADEMMDAIGQTEEVVGKFSKIAQAVAMMNDVDSAIEMYRWFGNLFERYNLPDNYNGRFTEADQDFFKFLGHEMLVTLIAFLMREQQWQTLARVLDGPIPMHLANRGLGNVGWEYASEHLLSLLDESPRRQRMSLHADILNQRHQQGDVLASVLPMQDLMDADYFLFLLSRTLKDDSGFDRHYWRAWSCLYLKHTPAFIQSSERMRFAEEAARALGLASVGAFKKLLAERGPELRRLFSFGFWDYPIEPHDVDRIGTR